MKISARKDQVKCEIRVLYVEDDAASRNLVRRAFEHHSTWQLYLANSILEAREQLSLGLDIILLDIQLPDGSGYDFLSTIRCCPETRDIPVIAVSANAMGNEVARGLEAGFNHYLTKPLDLNELFGVIISLA